MANHFYVDLGIYPGQDGSIDPKVIDFIKENKLPFKVYAFEADDFIQVMSITVDVEFRRSFVMKGLDFGIDQVERLYPFFKDAVIVLSEHDECNGGPTTRIFIKDGKEVFAHSQHEDLGLQVNARNVYTPEDYAEVHYWDTDEYKEKSRQQNKERMEKQYERSKDMSIPELAKAYVKSYTQTETGFKAEFSNFANDYLQDKLEDMTKWVEENKPTIKLPF